MLEPQSFIYPVGELQKASFPDEDIETSLAQWMVNATAQVSGLDSSIQDAAATHLIYGYAYQSIASRLANRPNQTNSFGDVIEVWSSDRVRFWEQRAEAKFNAYAVLAGSATGSNEMPTHSSTSAAVKAVW